MATIRPTWLLVGGAVAGDGDLDLVRGGLADGDAVLGGREQDDAAGLADGERGLGVLAEEQPLDAEERRAVGLDELGHAPRG